MTNLILSFQGSKVDTLLIVILLILLSVLISLVVARVIHEKLHNKLFNGAGKDELRMISNRVLREGDCE